MPSLRGAFSLFILLLFLVPSASSALDVPDVSGASVVHSRERIPCGRDRVAVDIFEPAEEGIYPAVILLHGSHGPGRAEGHYLRQAEEFARNGYVSLFVRYYDRGRKGRGNRQVWSETISGALTFATNMRKVDHDRLALVGYSQGAFLALNAAPLDERVRAVVAFYGGLSPGFKEPACRAMPPTLLFHGTRDRIVPVRRALETMTWLKSTGRPADLVVYRGASHGFNLSSRGGVDEKATEDSWRRTLSFLDYYLRYPAWDPAQALPEPGVTGIPEPEQARYFDQEPLAAPFLTEPEGEEGEEPFALINPDPESVPQEVFKKKKGGKRGHSKAKSSSARKSSKSKGHSSTVAGKSPGGSAKGSASKKSGGGKGSASKKRRR